MLASLIRLRAAHAAIARGGDDRDPTDTRLPQVLFGMDVQKGGGGVRAVGEWSRARVCFCDLYVLQSFKVSARDIVRLKVSSGAGC